jgi:hypothetical protein
MTIQSPRPFTPTAREASLDDTIESSFPASDPPSSIPDPEVPERAWEPEPDNRRLGLALLGIAVGAAAVWLALRYRRA